MPQCGRATKAASPSSATRSNAIRGDSRSKIAWKNGCRYDARLRRTAGTADRPRRGALPPAPRRGSAAAVSTCRGACLRCRCTVAANRAPPRPAGTRRSYSSARRDASSCRSRRPGSPASARAAAGRTRSSETGRGAGAARQRVFIGEPAPGDVAGVERFCTRRELRAHHGTDAVGADQQITAASVPLAKWAVTPSGILRQASE